MDGVSGVAEAEQVEKAHVIENAEERTQESERS